ncbi:hypothetical protein HKBW3S03_02247, partial [Candidatus Hakubella thermalkaliphila]
IFGSFDLFAFNKDFLKEGLVEHLSGRLAGYVYTARSNLGTIYR